MSKGGGGGPTHTTSDVTQSNLPEYARPYYQDLMARAGYESAVPYTPYAGSRLAMFSPQEQTAMDRISALGVSGTGPELDTQAMIAGQVGSGNPYADSMLNATRYAQSVPLSYGGRMNYGQLQPYMSPYQQAVVDVEKREATRQSDMMGRDVGLQAAGAGSLGGYREALMQSERERNLGQQLGDIQTRGSQSAYEAARQAYEADRAARFSAEQYNAALMQRGAELGQSAYGQIMSGDQQRLAAAGMLGDVAAQRQMMELERLNAMMGTGAQQRDLYQRSLDVGYQDFLRQQAFPREQLQFYSGLLQGVPVQPGTTTASYGQAPSFGQQALGAGIAGLGLYNQLQRGAG